jgi:hypothetical protein
MFGRAQGAQERIHHFLPVSDFVFADMRAALVAEYAAHLEGGASPIPSPRAIPAAPLSAVPDTLPDGGAASLACGAGGPGGSPAAVQLAASAGGAGGKAERGGALLRTLSPSTPLAVCDDGDVLMSAAAAASQFLLEVPSEVMYYI